MDTAHTHMHLHACVHTFTYAASAQALCCMSVFMSPPCSGTDGLAFFVASNTFRLYAPDSYLGNQQMSYGLNFTITVLLLDGAVPATQFPVYLSGGALGLTLIGSAAVADSQTSPGPGGDETLLTLTVSPLHW